MLDDSDKLNIYNKDLTGDEINFTDNEIPVQPPRRPKKSSNAVALLIIFIIFGCGGYGIFSAVSGASNALGSLGIGLKKQSNETPESNAPNGNESAMNEAESFYNEVTKNGAKETADQDNDTVVDVDIPAAQKDNKAVDDKAKFNADKNEVDIPVQHNLARQNPFLPYMETVVKPTGLPYELISPPDEVIDQTPAVEMMQTTVSGIMYDKYRPSAIINVDGKDQLVHKGDKLSNFVVLNITPDKVIVKTGTNIYRASVGQTIGDDVFTFNPNNTRNQFGGAYTKRPKRVLEITSY